MGYSLHLSLKNIENLQRSSDFSHLIMHNLASLACFQMRFFFQAQYVLKSMRALSQISDVHVFNGGNLPCLPSALTNFIFKSYLNAICNAYQIAPCFFER